MPRRAALTLIMTSAIAAALISCSTDAGDTPTTAPPAGTTTTVALDPFDSDVYGSNRETVARIINIGHQRQETDNAILAALTASYAEAGFYAALEGTSYDLFGWVSRAVQVRNESTSGFAGRNRPAYQQAAIDNFYQHGHELNISTDDPVDYAVTVQTAETAPKDLGDGNVTYWEDRENRYPGTGSWQNEFIDIAAVKAKYTEALPYARAAFDQLG